MPRFSPADALAIVLQHPIVPVFYHADAAYATRILRACYAGGLRVFEFTNRGPEALAVFMELAAVVRQQLPELLLGIGTIYTAAQAEEFIAAGADFVVQPVTTAEVAAVCHAHELPWLPGALTVNEIYQASQLGAAIVKIFPGNLVGPDYIKALRGPMPQVKLMVTGGVEPTQSSLAEWFEAGVNVVGMGSQLFKNVDDTAAFTDLLRQLLGWARG